MQTIGALLMVFGVIICVLAVLDFLYRISE